MSGAGLVAHDLARRSLLQRGRQRLEGSLSWSGTGTDARRRPRSGGTWSARRRRASSPSVRRRTCPGRAPRLDRGRPQRAIVAAEEEPVQPAGAVLGPGGDLHRVSRLRRRLDPVWASSIAGAAAMRGEQDESNRKGAKLDMRGDLSGGSRRARFEARCSSTKIERPRQKGCVRVVPLWNACQPAPHSA